MEGLLNDLLSGMILQVVGKLQSTNRHMDSTWGFWDQWFIAMDWNAREKKQHKLRVANILYLSLILSKEKIPLFGLTF